MEEIADPSKLKYDASGLIPCVVQQYDTGEVLMVAWMNEESVGLTLKTGTTWFWSRSRQELWNKGATRRSAPFHFKTIVCWPRSGQL